MGKSYFQAEGRGAACASMPKLSKEEKPMSVNGLELISSSQSFKLFEKQMAYHVFFSVLLEPNTVRSCEGRSLCASYFPANEIMYKIKMLLSLWTLMFARDIIREEIWI